jgi:hypothetical protein
LKAGERTANVKSGEISSIILCEYPASIANEACGTVHQPGRLQKLRQISQAHGGDAI